MHVEAPEAKTIAYLGFPGAQRALANEILLDDFLATTDEAQAFTCEEDAQGQAECRTQLRCFWNLIDCIVGYHATAWHQASPPD